MHFRKLSKGDQDAFRAHLLRLDPESRRLRFCAAASDDAVSAYAGRTDWSKTIVVGAFEEGTLRGVCEIIPSGTGWAEAALSVEKEHQKHGVGRTLLRKALARASNRGLDKLRLDALPENLKMRRLASGFPHEAHSEDGCVEFDLPAAPANPATIADEAMDEALAGWTAAMEAMEAFVLASAPQPSASFPFCQSFFGFDLSPWARGSEGGTKMKTA